MLHQSFIALGSSYALVFPSVTFVLAMGLFYLFFFSYQKTVLSSLSGLSLGVMVCGDGGLP